jgi:O-antigen ligase
VGAVSLRTRRPLVLALTGLGLAIVLAFSAWLAYGRLSAGSSRAAHAALPQVPLAVDKTLGVNADLSRLDAGGREEALTAMEGAGFRWLRQRFAWDALEPEQGVFSWKVWDEIVEGASRHNLALIAVLDGSPVWARAGEDAENALAPPAQPRDFGDFAAAVALRYGSQIDHYQIWDEPNIAPHWGTREIDPAAYARLLREGAIRIRAVDDGAVILAAALAPNVEPGGANMSEVGFLDTLYENGAAQWFDVLAAQPYSFDQPVDALPDPEKLNWGRVALLRNSMEAHDDEETAVWAVSFGLSEATPEAVSGAVEQAREDWPWLGPMVWAAWSPDDVHGVYALTSANGQPKPPYEALQGLATAPAVAWPAVYPADHPSGSYEGDWRVTPSGADIGSSGDRLIVRFRGTRLDLTVRRGDYRAFLFVTVDGQPANALPRDTDGRAYVVLYDPLGAPDRVTLAQDLLDGEHVADIVAERGWGQWAIVGWSVAREVPGQLPWLPGLLGLAAVAVLGVTIHGAWPHRVLLADSVSLLVTRYRALDDRLLLALTATAAILLYAMVGTIPTLLALGLLALLLFFSPEMGLPLIALALPFSQLGRPMLGKVFSMVEILTLLTAAGWLANRALSIGKWGAHNRQHDGAHFRRLVSGLSTLDWGVVALTAVGAASLLWAEHGRVAAREYRTVILEAAVFYGLLRAMARGKRVVWRVADAWVLGGTLIALVGLFQWAFGQNLITAEGIWRVRGFYGSPNNLALYLGRLFPLGVAVALWGRRRGRRWIYGLAALVMALVLFLTYSRGAWVLGVPASLLFLAAMRGRRALVAIAAVLAVLAVVVVLIVGAGRLTSLLDTTEGTTFFRLQLWQSSWAMIRDQPLLGVGLDNFLYAYRSHYVLPTAWEEFDLSHPHNLVFDFWLRLGLPGLLILVWLVVAFFRQGWQAYKRSPEGDRRLLTLGLMAGMVNFVAHGLVDNAFFLVDLAFAFVLMLALIQAIDGQQQIGDEARSQHRITDIGGF